MLGIAGEFKRYVLLCTPTQGHTSVGRPAKIYVYQLRGDIGCRLENLSRAKADMDGERERERERERIYVVDAP